MGAVEGDDHGLASRETVPGGDIARAAAVLQELFHHAGRDAKTPGYLGPADSAFVIGIEDPFP